MGQIKKRIRFYTHAPNEIFASLFMKFAFFLPDRLYLRGLFRLKMGYSLNLEKPVNFNEKLQWLKLYNRQSEYVKMVDKYAVKQYVSELIGSQYIIQTYGCWNTFAEIDFDVLPDKFVLKTTNGGGNTGVVLCADKRSFDREDAKRRLNHSMKTNIYHRLREWPYKNVVPRIIAEEYMEDSSLGELRDYKFFCFDGYVDCVMVCSGRQSGRTKFYFFDKDWKLVRLNKLGKAAPENFTLPKPSNMEEMFAIAAKLSKGIPFSRIDLYSVEGKTYFGEITFFPDSGFDKNILPEADRYWGRLIDTKSDNI